MYRCVNEITEAPCPTWAPAGKCPIYLAACPPLPGRSEATTSPALLFPTHAWRAFVAGVRAGRFPVDG
nr:DUF397 domain-containing protein [Kitasatospora mediocidica]